MMPRALAALVLPFALVLASCGGRPATPPAIEAAAFDLEHPFAEALELEQLGSDTDALEAHLALLDRAIALPSAPLALEAALASLDALVLRNVPGLDLVTENNALAFRVPGGMRLVRERLDAAWEKAAASGPFVRPTIARAAYRLAMHEGEVEAAALWRRRMGCAREATVVGPLRGAALVAMKEPTPIEKEPELLASYPGPGPFAKQVAPTVVSADECALPIEGDAWMAGLRAVVVDVEVPRPMRMGLSLRSSSAASVIVGEKTALVRGYERGGAYLFALATADVPAGLVRTVVRLAHRGEGRSIELAFFDPEGMPLRIRAPRPGDRATVGAVEAEPIAFRALRDGAEERALVAAAWLALDDAHPAAYLLEAPGAASPLVDLLYARALAEGSHLPRERAAERWRGAHRRVLASWPTAWEPIVGEALLEGARHTDAEAQVAMLRALDALAPKEAKPAPLLAVEATLATWAKMPDRAEKALSELRDPLATTPLLAALSGVLEERAGAAKEAWACTAPSLDRSSLACHDAKFERGDFQGALEEIERLRRLRGSPEALRDRELAHRLALFDFDAALEVWKALPPSEKVAGPLIALAEHRGEKVRARLPEALGARDILRSLGPLHRALGDDPAKPFEAEAERLVAADRKKKVLPQAATAVLMHRERYTLHPNGLLHYVIHDLRRVSGTTDVELGAHLPGPLVEGQETRSRLRLRIHKANGRIVEPDAAPFAEQAHADLASLRPGDYIEQVFEGWALPDAMGQLVVDTPDLLPERTSVREAVVELRHPEGLPLQWAAHELFEPAEVMTQDGQTTVKLTLRNQGPRRTEMGVSQWDRAVALSFGTRSWEDVGQAFAESLAMLSDDDPEVLAWARRAAGGEKKGRKLLENLVQAAGQSVRMATTFAITDGAALHARGPQTTSARTMLELGEGSRSYLVHRALSLLGLPSELRLVEREPYSTRENLPAHTWRFQQPVVVAQLDDDEVLLDLDVLGPPLPPGHTSPELRGRASIGPDGKLSQISAPALRLRDEVDLALSLDERGRATGKVKMVLRGQSTRLLAEALEQVVGSERENMLRSIVLGFLPRANVDEVRLSSAEGSWEVAIEAEVSFPSYATLEGGELSLPGTEPVHVVFPYAFAGTLGSTLASLSERQEALSLSFALDYRFRRRIELPPSWSLASAPEQVEIRDPHLEASRTVRLDEGVLHEEMSLSLPSGTLPKDRYEAFVTTARKVDEGFLRELRLVQKP